MSSIDEIDVGELQDWIADGAKVLDVRNPEEYLEKRIPGVIHIPIEELEDRYTELDKTEKYCVVCALGGRSARAVEFLSANGYEATNVAGGTDGWTQLGNPIESN